MATKKKFKSKSKANGKVLANGDRVVLESRAIVVDRELTGYLEGVNQSFLDMSKLLAEVAEKKLWLYLPDPRPNSHGFKNIKDYGNYRFGKMGKSKVYELISIAALTEGPNALTEKEIRKLGPKKSAALARMEPEKRTPEVIDKATTLTFAEVDAMVQESVNEDLPEDQRTETTVMFARTVAVSVAAEMERLEAVGINMEGIRSADRSVSRVSKFWGCAVLAMRHYFAEELAGAERYMSCDTCHGEKGERPSDSRSVAGGGKICGECLSEQIKRETANATKAKVAAEKLSKAEARAGEAQAEEGKANGQSRGEDIFPDYENESQARGARHTRPART